MIHYLIFINRFAKPADTICRVPIEITLPDIKVCLRQKNNSMVLFSELVLGINTTYYSYLLPLMSPIYTLPNIRDYFR